MKTTAKIITIGNSKGIRIPKQALIESGITVDVELETGPNELIIRSKKSIREGWEDAYAQMAQQGEDQLLLGSEPASDWDNHEWQW
jgi:antitoxin MazE